MIKLLTGVSIYVWLALGGAVVFGLITYKAYSLGYERAEAVWVAKAHEATIAKLERELRTARDAADQEERQRRELEAEKDELEKQLDEYLLTLENRPDKCPLTDDDLRGLR